ncbi:MAG: Crp/Fnr family transcriptional regulator, partial [Bacteroidales bacterium]|nr:Crp/Fnr family transcriptional regulator [Bacteroidales bacterium]
NNLQVDIIATTKVRVLRISKREMIELLNRHPRIMENYLRIISDRFVIITQKMKFLSLKTMRGKIAHYLLMREKRKQQNKQIRKHKTQEQLAEYFGVTRPSLTRELKIMEKEGLIYLQDKEIKILDKARLLDLMRR